MTQTATCVESVRGGRRYRIAHAEDPARPGIALCGTKLGGTPASAAGERCVVCLELTRRTFLGR